MTVGNSRTWCLAIHALRVPVLAGGGGVGGGTGERAVEKILSSLSKEKALVL